MANEGGGPKPAKSAAVDARESADQLAKGASLGRYVVLGLIGRGGMGDVYAAFDPELNRKIAIKLLKARGAGAAEGRQRMLREAQAMAQLSHPNVVVVHDVGTFGDAVFIAMEFIEGHTLGYWMQAAKRSWREVLEVFAAAGRGLVAAHAAGLVHRDFKPDNVMITTSGQVRVMDFGLARSQQENAPSPVQQTFLSAEARAAAIAQTLEAGGDPDATARLASGGGPAVAEPTSASGGYLQMKLTQTGTFAGTPAYMSPEQFGGESGDARTDQFSFCVALYQALYDTRPFPGNDVIQLMVSVAGGEVGEPPANTRVPKWIRKILLRGLRVDPGDRYPSMTALLTELGRDPAVRRRRWSALAAVMLLVVATGAGVRRLGADRRELCAAGPDRAAGAWGPERRRAVERAFLASGSPSAARAFATTAALMDEYVGRWTQLYNDTCEATHVRGEQSAEVLDLRMACLGEHLGSVRVLSEILAGADAQIVDNAVAAASAIPTLARCSDIPMLRAVLKPPDDPAKRARVEALREDCARVTALAAAGQCERATAAGEKLLAAATPLGYQPLTAEALLAVGRLGESCSDPSKAVELLEEALYAAESSHHDQVVIEASMFVSLYYAERMNDVPPARRWVRHGQALLARFPGHPVLEAWMMNAHSLVLLLSGENAAAIEETRRALALLEKERGPDHLDVAIEVQNLGVDFYESRRYAEAEPTTRRALEGMKRLFGGDSARTAVLHINYGEVLTELRRFDEARTHLEEGLATFRKQNAGPFFVAFGLNDLGRLELAKGDAKAARSTLQEARRILGDGNPGLAAEVDFGLAQTSWAVPADRPSAVKLARQARATIAATKGSARKLADMDAWLAAHAERG